MKKQFFYLILFAMVMVFSTACKEKQNNDGDRVDNLPDSQLDTTNQLVLRYCNLDFPQFIPVGQSDVKGQIFNQEAAILLTEEMLADLYANRIIKVAAFISDQTTQYSDLVFWVKESLDGEKIWECKYDKPILLAAWNEMVVSPYFKLQKGKTYYLGYSIKADLLPICGDGNQMFNPDATYLYDCNQKKWIQYNQFGNLLLTATVSGQYMPQNDISVLGIAAPQFVKSGESFDVGLNLFNKACKDDIVSFDFVAKIGDKEIFRKNVVLNTPLKYQKSVTVFVKDLKIDNGGINEIVYLVDKVNGESDSNLDDNRFKISTDVSALVTDRLVLLENFTGAGCTGCPFGHDALKDAIKELGQGNFNWVCHHSGYNKDQFTTQQDDSCVVFYNLPQTYAPAIMLDRMPLQNIGTFGTSKTTPAAGPAFSVNMHAENSSLTDIMRMAVSHKSPVKLSETHTYDPSSRKLTVTVDGTILSPLVDVENLGVGVMILEDSIPGRQNGSTESPYYFMDVAREGPTSVFTDKINVNGDRFSYTVSIVIDKTYKLELMQVVSWVANRPSSFNYRKNINDCFVYQSTVNDIL